MRTLIVGSIMAVIFAIVFLLDEYGGHFERNERRLRKAKRAVDGVIHDAHVRMNRAVSKNWLDDL